MTVSKAKIKAEKTAAVKEAKVFDISKYMISNDVKVQTVDLPNGVTFEVSVKPISWSKKNQLVAKAMAFGGKSDGMSFDADFYVKECLKAMVVKAPWGETNDVFLISITDELGKALEALVPKAFENSDEDEETELKKE
jgi:hypothetical protein